MNDIDKDDYDICEENSTQNWVREHPKRQGFFAFLL